MKHARMVAMIWAVAVGFAVTACDAEQILGRSDGERVEGSGVVVTETRAVDGFSAIVFSTEGTITLTQGPSEGLTVETDENLMPYLVTEVRAGVLTIEADGVDLEPSDGIRWDITVVDLESVTLSGAGRLDVGEVVTDRFDLTMSGAMDVVIDRLTAQALDVTLSGAGAVRVSGTVDTETLRLSGVGAIDAADVIATDATAVVTGTGDISVTAAGTLDASISGVGTIGYSGAPALTEQVTGIGSIRRIGGAK